jgi:DNA-binding Lrp family transcriptional regulator
MPEGEPIAAAPVDTLDARLLRDLHHGFALDERPFAGAAAAFGISEEELLERLQRLLARGVLLRFGPVFRAERFGGCFAIAALAVPPARCAEVAALVQAVPEVTQNYRRDHEFNMWLAVASETAAGVDAALARIARRSGLRPLVLAPEHEYGRATAAAPRPAAALDAFERRLLAATQSGLPLVARPYEALAAMLGTDGATVREGLRRWLAQGLVRRIGTVPDDERLGPMIHAMSVWDVADAAVDPLGERLAALPFVDHAYRRPRRPPAWPYNLHAVHRARDAGELRSQRDAIRTLLGGACRTDDVLCRTAVLKKTGLRIAED